MTTVFKILVLSAKAATRLDLITSGSEFAYKRNSKRRKIEPWGTSDITGSFFDEIPVRLTSENGCVGENQTKPVSCRRNDTDAAS